VQLYGITVGEVLTLEDVACAHAKQLVTAALEIQSALAWS